MTGLVETRIEGGLATLTLDDPRRRNILSVELCAALGEALDAAEADPAIRLIAVTGAGKAFCAGADLEDLKSAAAGQTGPVEAVYDAFLRVARSPLPTLALVNGPAIGAGMNLALACDMRVAAETAIFDTRFLSIGLHPGGGHAWMLLRAVGWQNAVRLLLAGETLDAEAAVAAGLAIRAVARSELDEAALTLAARLERVPRELLMRTKQSLRLAATQDHAAAVAHETSEQMWSLQQPAFADLVAQLQGRIAGR